MSSHLDAFRPSGAPIAEAAESSLVFQARLSVWGSPHPQPSIATPQPRFGPLIGPLIGLIVSDC